MDSAGFAAFRRAIARGWTFLAATPGWRLGAWGVGVSLLTVQLLLVALTGVRTVQDAVLEHGTVYLDVVPGTLDQRVQEMYAQLRGIPSIREVAYVPREQVFADESARDASLGEFLEQYDLANPFPDAFVVVPASAEAYADLRAFVEASDTGIDAVALSDIAAREAATGQLLDAADTAHMGARILLLLSACTAAILSVNFLVHLSALRREELTAEILAGATGAVASAPLVIAGAIALLGALFWATVAASLCVVFLAYVPSSAAVGSWLLGSVLAGWSAGLPLMLGIEAACMVLLSWIIGRAVTVFRA